MYLVPVLVSLVHEVRGLVLRFVVRLGQLTDLLFQTLTSCLLLTLILTCTLSLILT